MGQWNPLAASGPAVMRVALSADPAWCRLRSSSAAWSVPCSASIGFGCSPWMTWALCSRAWEWRSPSPSRPTGSKAAVWWSPRTCFSRSDTRSSRTVWPPRLALTGLCITFGSPRSTATSSACLRKKWHAATALPLAHPMPPRTPRADLRAWAFPVFADVHFWFSLDTHGQSGVERRPSYIIVQSRDGIRTRLSTRPQSPVLGPEVPVLAGFGHPSS